MAARAILTTTWPGPATGSGRSTTVASRLPRNETARTLFLRWWARGGHHIWSTSRGWRASSAALARGQASRQYRSGLRPGPRRALPRPAGLRPGPRPRQAGVLGGRPHPILGIGLDGLARLFFFEGQAPRTPAGASPE